jgi:hypothetical protein
MSADLVSRRSRQGSTPTPLSIGYVRGLPGHTLRDVLRGPMFQYIL